MEPKSIPESQAFEAKCPACKTRLKVDPQSARPLSRCPSCGAVLRLVQPRVRKKTKPDSDETLGRVAFWICGLGALLMIGSILGLLAAGTGWPFGKAPPGRTTPAPPGPTSGIPTASPSRTAEPERTEGAEDEAEPVRETIWSPAPSPTREQAPGRTEDERHVVDAVPSPLPARLEAAIIDIRADVFAYRKESSEGLILWRAAPLNHHYVFITLKLSNSGGTSTRLYFDPRNAESLIRLAGRDETFATCLGRLRGRGSAVRQFDLRPWPLPAGARNQELTVGFIVPESWRDGRLQGPGFDSGVIRLPRPDRPVLKSLSRLSGWWVRAAGQPLKLYYSDAVMSALREPGVRRLLITRDGEETKLAVPFAEVTGALSWSESAEHPGELSFTLARGSARLKGRARLVGRNDILILYASDDPFDQVIYTFKPF